MHKLRGKAWYNHVNDISIYLGRQRRGGVPDQKNELEALSCSFCPSAGVLHVCKMKKIALMVQSKERMCEMQLRTPPHSVYLGRQTLMSFM